MPDLKELPELPSDRDRGGDPARRAWVWVVYLGLYAASIPWYLPPDDRPAIWLGLPYGVVLSLAATTGIAGFTVFVVSRYWRDPAEISSADPGPGRR
jgi:hypothetical protein